MEKKYEDDELDQLINEQFINEAQIMEEALFSDDDTEDYEASDEEIKASYQQLVDRLKAEGVYREDGKDRGDANRNGCGDACRKDRGNANRNDCGDADRNGRDKCNMNDECCEEEYHNGQEGKSVKGSSLPAHEYVGDGRSRSFSNINNDKNADIFNASVKNTTTIPGTKNTINMSGKTDKVISVPETKKKFNLHKVGKVAGIIVVSGLCVFAASMTSEANRNYFVKNIKYLTGDRTKIVVDNDENNEMAKGDEYAARKNIEEQLGIEVPEFFYRPDDFEFYKYNISPTIKTARMEYIFNGSIIEFHVDKIDETSGSRFYSLSGDELESFVMEEKKIHIIIKKIQDEQDKKPTYLAQWEYDNVLYSISGKIEYDELEKMLEFMEYDA